MLLLNFINLIFDLSHNHLLTIYRGFFFVQFIDIDSSFSRLD